MLDVLRGMRQKRRLAQYVYRVLVERSRAPEFFRDLGVPDTLDGRFDMMTLHAWLVLSWLKNKGAPEIAQRLTDMIFVGFDEGLRDLGAGDIGIGHRVKKMANAFYGRLQVYGESQSTEALAQSLTRNVYRDAAVDPANVTRLAHYVIAVKSHLAGCDLAMPFEFGPLP